MATQTTRNELSEPPADLVPMIKRLYDSFGPERLMWASDCPYQLNDGNSYEASISLITDRIDFLTKSDKQWLLPKTAEAVFFA
jgi:predicted TIM-barrel fold metal-dependent hydrolase